MILLSWGSQLKLPEVKKEHWNGVHEIYGGELVLDFKNCLSNIVIIFKLTGFNQSLTNKVITLPNYSSVVTLFCIWEKQIKLN